MEKYICNICKKEYKKLDNYTKHINKKNCIIYTDKLVKDYNENIVNYSKPILKWVGGKTQIIDKLIINFPVEINKLSQ